MALFADGKLLLIVLLLGALVYLVINKKYKTGGPIHNEGALADIPKATPPPGSTDADSNDTIDSVNSSESSVKTLSYDDDASTNTSNNIIMPGETSDQIIRNKFRTRDSADKGKYKRSNYASGNRDQGNAELGNFFKVSDPFTKDMGNNFTGVDEGGENHASYVPGRTTRLTEKEKFDAAALLPDGTAGQDWFHNAYSSTSVKNKHLINIYRPVGVNTIQGTLKNPDRTVRGNEICPKAVISPWLNSSYEPDNNIRGLCVAK